MNHAGPIKPWLLALRPKTLSAAVVPVVVGSALAYAFHAQWIFGLALWALLGALFIQVGTNLFNDAIDFKKGADTDERIGPKRVTQSKLLNGRAVMWGGAICFLAAVACGIPLVLKGGWVLVVIGLFSLGMGYAYTGGPFPLAYRGLGDLFVVLFFGLIAVGGVFFLHTNHYSWPTVVAGLQVGVLATVLIAINNYRDHVQDIKVNKRTLAVRFGPQFAKNEILILNIVAYALLPLWAYWGKPWAAILPLLTLPLAWAVVQGVRHSTPGPILNQYLARSSLVHILFGIALSIGLVWS